MIRYKGNFFKSGLDVGDKFNNTVKNIFKSICDDNQEQVITINKDKIKNFKDKAKTFRQNKIQGSGGIGR